VKLTPSWNAKTRLLLTLELAVILPVAVLIGLSVHHLKHIEDPDCASVRSTCIYL
jgi:hypothetical protein